ncbi:MAG: pyridoxal phosphate-dependent aminotransferase [Terriglobus sp.]
MQLASRTDFLEEPSRYAEALKSARLHVSFIDLTVSNPTRCGFDYSAISLGALSTPASLRYDANSLGSHSAREAVATMYPGIAVEQILLTASTSEAYSYLLRLLCEPGDAILVPTPSYPLFDLLARLHDVDLLKYPLVYHDGWQMDPASLHAAITPRTRAIVAIHPNNPTGHYCSEPDRQLLYEVAAQYGLALIVDEVFLDYGVQGRGQTFAQPDRQVMTFTLSGLSKVLALPQMKLAWTIATGPAGDMAEAMRRLEIIADTYLSTATPVQVALPTWLARREEIQRQITTRVEQNLVALDAALQDSACSRLRVDGGWCVVLRVPALLEDRAVAVHPGSFYGFPVKGWLVVSLLPEPGTFREGMQRIIEACSN